MEILRKNILDTFKSYVDGFCGIGPGVNLKYAHSLRVAALSERIAQSLSIGAKWAAGDCLHQEEGDCHNQPDGEDG